MFPEAGTAGQCHSQRPSTSGLKSDNVLIHGVQECSGELMAAGAFDGSVRERELHSEMKLRIPAVKPPDGYVVRLRS